MQAHDGISIRVKFSSVLFSAHCSSFHIGNLDSFLLNPGSSEFAIGGMADLGQTLAQGHEFLSATCPRIEFLEKQPSLPGVYRDNDGKPSKFQRQIELPIYVKESERTFNWKGGKQAFEQPAKFYASPISLRQTDYIPSSGDVFRWRDTWRQITTTKVDPSDYFQNTGFPLYILLESSLWVPEFRLNGMVADSPVKNLTPISDTDLLEPACGCPIKTPKCYEGACGARVREITPQ